MTTPSRFMCRLSIGFAAAVAFASSASAGEKRAVIELFTSQGCSSCPSADRLLGELSRDRSLVALSLSVEYWDYLGWKDTLALAGHAMRQRGYAKSRGDRQVYTPQAVVNGVAHTVGSDRAAIERAIGQSTAKPGTMSVPVTVADAGGRITVTLPDSSSGARGEVWLCGVKKAIAVQIERGENRGRKVTYHNVVRDWHKLGEWTGQSRSWTVSRSDFKAGVDEAAVIVQERSNGHPGRVLGAANIALK
jgi:hypothetical protein